jgi:hypothetical protein
MWMYFDKYLNIIMQKEFEKLMEWAREHQTIFWHAAP